MTIKKENNTGKGFLFKALSFLGASPIAQEQKVEPQFDYQRVPVIPFFRCYNEFPLMLASLAESVPVHNGAIRAKRRWSTAENFSVSDVNPCSILNNEQTSEGEIDSDDIIDLEEFICSMNVKDQTLMDLVRMAITDMETTGNGYIELIRGVVADESFFFVEHHDATTALLIRREEEITVGFSPDWRLTEQRDPRAPLFELPLYKGKRTNWKEVNGTQRCCIHLKSYQTGRFWYGLPESIASLLSQKISFEINRHNLDRLETDFFPRVFMEFFGVDGMDEAAQEEHLAALEATFTKKSRERSGIFAQYNETAESNMKLHKLEVDNTGDFVPLSVEQRQQILTAHGTPAIVAGVQTPGQLGNSKEVRETFELYNATTIKPLQKFLVENMITPILKEASGWLEEFEGLYLTMSTTTPVSFMGEIDVNRILTVNEGRREVGYGELTDDVNGEIVRDERGDRIINDKSSDVDIN
jgi:hypothetical protein